MPTLFYPLSPADTPSPQTVPGLSFSQQAYVRQLMQLLPRGRALDSALQNPDSNLIKTLNAIADELARVDARAVDLANESDPRSAVETLADWERMLSLPDDRVQAIPATTAGRQVAVTQKYGARGGQNVDYFVKLCALCGWTLAGGTLPNPAPTAARLSTTGGSLAPGTYSYRVSAYNFQGETDSSAQAHAVVGAGTSTNVVQVSWAAVPGARGYRIYGRTIGNERFLGRVVDTGAGSFTFDDDGSITPTGTPPASNTATYPAIEKFAAKVARSGPTRCGDPLDGAAWAYTQLLNLQPPSGTYLDQASLERVVRHATHSHITDVFVYH